MPFRVFALDSTYATAPTHATVMGKLATLNAANFNFTPTITTRATTYDSNVVMVCVNVTDAELAADSDLANLRAASYPNAHCQHQWSSLENFRALGGFHQIGGSERSYERDRSGLPMTGREMIYIRPQIGITASVDNYGRGDGTNAQNAINGCQDYAIDQNTIGKAVWNKGYSYCRTDGLHVRRSRYHLSPADQNPDYGSGVATSGRMLVEDATAADADKIYVYDDWDILPAIVWGGQYGWQVHSQIPWELYDATNNIWVLGSFNTGFSGTSTGSTSNIVEGDIDDITPDLETLMTRHIMHGVGTTYTDLEGDSGRGRFYVQSFGAATDFLAVKKHDTSSFTDVTSEAASATANDFEIVPVGAPNDFCVYFILASQYSGAEIRMSQLQVGGTGVWEYHQGSDVWAAPTNINDPTSGFSAGSLSTGSAGLHWLQFNPKIDWATATIDGVEGYPIRWRKTGGTVTTAARGSQIRCKPSACFIHRWNDAAPGAIGLSHNGNNGLRLDLNTNSSGNIEFVRNRMCLTNQTAEWGSAVDVVLTGGQFGGIGAFGSPPTDSTWIYREGDYGTRYWDIDDHLHTSSSDPFIVEILATMAAYETVCAGDSAEQAILDEYLAAVGDTAIDYTCFDKLDDCLDLAWVGTGPYENNQDAILIFDGVKVRHPGDTLTRANGDAIFSAEGNDNHSFANYGDQRGTNKTYRKLFTEYGRMCTIPYQQANGNNDRPVSGACGFKDNHKYVYGYASGIGNQDDLHFPVGWISENDPDAGKYDNEPDDNMAGNGVMFWGFKDISGVGVVANDQGTTFRALFFDNPNSECWHIQGAFHGYLSTHAIRYNGTDTYDDVTDNLKNSGNTATALFSSGSTGAELILGTKYRVERKFRFNITTAGVGDAVITIKVSPDGGSNWNAVANVAGLDFSTTGLKEVTFDRPTSSEITSVDVDGNKTILAVKFEITSGSFSTIPQADEIATYKTCGSIDIQHCIAQNIDVSSGRYFGKLQVGVEGPTGLLHSGWVIDANNTIRLMAGQDSSTTFYGGNALAGKTLAQWQANSAAALTTDREFDCVFGVDNTLEAP